ncbi:hypothetical protein [Castellaniella sp.]|uniref:hypothetical protein n=1 Tax=Castellaniella sp. TaxID=1955812 RepID=UPI002AFEB676|nr:hypothetical protein [Castellaniella sp.]
MARRQRSIEVFDTPSGMGGSFTVSIEAVEGDRVKVRIWYGRATYQGWESWPDWDGVIFETTRDQLRNPRQKALYRDRE